MMRVKIELYRRDRTEKRHGNGKNSTMSDTITLASEAIIRPQATTIPVPAVSAEREEAYGAVTGRIQTLTSRNALRFTLYDHIHERAVACYLGEGREAMMRQMWGRVATVEGWVRRDPGTGRPLTVRRVSNVTPLTEVEPQDYMKARGALPRKDGDPLPEELAGQLRDAGWLPLLSADLDPTQTRRVCWDS